MKIFWDEDKELWISKEEMMKKYRSDQTCRFCEDPARILTKETCCTGCSKLKDKE